MLLELDQIKPWKLVNESILNFRLLFVCIYFCKTVLQNARTVFCSKTGRSLTVLVQAYYKCQWQRKITDLCCWLFAGTALPSNPSGINSIYTTRKFIWWCSFCQFPEYSKLQKWKCSWWCNCLCATVFAGIVPLQNKKEKITPLTSSAVRAKVSQVGLDSFGNRCNRNLTVLVILLLFQPKLNNMKVTKCISTTHGLNLYGTAYDNFTS